MSHENVLKLKQERLAKYTGGKLRRKERAVNKAFAQFAKVPKFSTLLDLPAFKEPEVTVPVVETRPAKDEAPEWRVEFSDGKTLTVRATSEKKARTVARDAEGLPRLPAGTKVERVSA